MSADLETLAARKQLLATRAALQRLHATNEVGKLREKSRWVRSIASVVLKPQTGAIAGAALLLAGRRPRLAHIAWWASVALVVMRLFRRGKPAA